MRFKRLRRLLIIGLAVALLLCVGVTVFALVAFSPSAACNSPAQGPARPGDSARTLLSGGLQRCYLLHVPPGYKPAQPVPVVFSLHGLASKPESQQDLTGWDKVADAENFVVVYPQGTGAPLRWNSSPEFNATSVDDVQFMRDMIADATKIVTVDAARIYVNGISNGGEMADRIACRLADRVAAVGMVTGTPPDSAGNCSPSRPVPVIAFQGTADPLGNNEGGPMGDASVLTWLMNLAPDPTTYVPSAQAWMGDWAKRNGCIMTPEVLPVQGDASGIRYTGCKDNAEVIFYTIAGGGHTWPGGSPFFLLGKTSTDINASETMWQFYMAHPLTGQSSGSNADAASR